LLIHPAASLALAMQTIDLLQAPPLSKALPSPYPPSSYIGKFYFLKLRGEHLLEYLNSTGTE